MGSNTQLMTVRYLFNKQLKRVGGATQQQRKIDPRELKVKESREINLRAV